MERVNYMRKPDSQTCMLKSACQTEPWFVKYNQAQITMKKGIDN